MTTGISMPHGTTEPPIRDNQAWIFGTWDFKWPQGRDLRIAIQRLFGATSNAPLNQAIDAFEAAIAGWYGAGDVPRAAISWQIDHERLLPAPLAFDSAESPIGDGHVEIPYDVLVSFAPLPVRIPRREVDKREFAVRTQMSELGSYALRNDYGVPTLFLGPDPRGGAEALQLAAWIACDDFRAAAVHEFGHALGIAHVHQNPVYRRGGVELKNEAGIRAALNNVPRFRSFPSDEIRPEIMDEWPHTYRQEGQERTVLFSDWAHYPTAQPFEETTTMAHPGWSRFLRDQEAPQVDRVAELIRPTEADLDLLAAMYPRR